MGMSNQDKIAVVLDCAGDGAHLARSTPKRWIRDRLKDVYDCHDSGVAYEFSASYERWGKPLAEIAISTGLDGVFICVRFSGAEAQGHLDRESLMSSIAAIFGIAAVVEVLIRADLERAHV